MIRRAVEFFLLFSISLWVGADIFFASVVAPVTFSTLMRVSGGRALAGDIVSPALTALHWMGIACGAVYLFSSALLSRFRRWETLAVRAMIVITLVSQLVITPRVHALRVDAEVQLPAFTRMHQLSVAMESVVILLGLFVVFRLSAMLRRDEMM